MTLVLSFGSNIMLAFARMLGLGHFVKVQTIANDFSTAVMDWLDAILDWLIAAFSGMVPVFYDTTTGLTFIGWLLVFGIAVAFTRLAFSFIQRAARM